MDYIKQDYFGYYDYDELLNAFEREKDINGIYAVSLKYDQVFFTKKEVYNWIAEIDDDTNEDIEIITNFREQFLYREKIFVIIDNDLYRITPSIMLAKENILDKTEAIEFLDTQNGINNKLWQ